MAGSYVSKYGDSLRRLAALDAGMTGQGPVLPGGPAPATGAFQMESGLNPRYEPASTQPAFAQAEEQAPAPAAAGGAFETAEKAQQPPISAAQAVEDLPDEAKEVMASELEKKTGKTVDEIYDELVKAGEIAPPAEKKPNRKEKLPRLAEALLRFAAHMGSGREPGAASALATMETESRRGALEQAEIDQENAAAASRRGEVATVMASRKARAEKKEDTADERKYKDADREDAQAHALELQRAQDRAAAARESGKNAVVFTDADGNVGVIDRDTGTIIPVMEDVEETVQVAPGQRGKPPLTETRTSKRRVKGLPRPDGTSTLDPDTVLRQIGEEKKRLAEDRTAKREAQAMVDAGDASSLDAAYEKMARRNVQDRMGSGGAASNGDDPLGLRQ